MEIDSRFTGTRLKPFHMVVHWRDTMNYAAAVQDDNPVYFDDQRQGGVIAPPLYNVAVTWPVVERISEYIDAPEFPKQVLSSLVHYTEHLEFHRPVVPGDRLVIDGRVAAILPHRAGTHIVLRFDVRDHKGDAVFTEHIGAMLRGIVCLDKGRGRESLPVVPEKGERGASLWTCELPVGRLQSFIYDGCTHIVFPIHTSVRFARQVGLPGIILQGTATLAYALREIVDREADGDPTRIGALFCRFTGMVLPGTRIQVMLEEGAAQAVGKQLYFIVLNQDGKKAISGGYVFLNQQEGQGRKTKR